MEVKKELIIGFGVLVPPIAKQLKVQGLQFDIDKVKHFEKLRESMHRLQFSDLINDSTREKITQKLFNQIQKHVVSFNKIKR